MRGVSRGVEAQEEYRWRVHLALEEEHELFRYREIDSAHAGVERVQELRGMSEQEAEARAQARAKG